MPARPAGPRRAKPPACPPDKPEKLRFSRFCWCGREDSNFHGLSATATSTLRVYQFRHDRTREMRRTDARRPGKARPLAKAPQARNGAGRSHAGTVVNAPFTRCPPDRMAMKMVGPLALALMAAADPPPPPRMVVSAQARASVRIVAAARVRLGAAPQPDGYAVRPARITIEDGTHRDARLVEFQ